MDILDYYKATLNDVQTLVEHRIMFALELGGNQPQEIVDKLGAQMTEYFSQAMNDNTCISFIAKCGENVAGIGSMHIRQMPGNFKNLSGKWGYIMNMYTLPDYRRMGVCKTILNLLVEEGKLTGVTAFELHATKEGEYVYSKNEFEIYKEPTYRRYII